MAADVVGLILAAGEGRRLGGPKALIRGSSGETWLGRTVGAVREAGVDDVVVVVGASADIVRAQAPAGCRLVEAPDWHDGMGASLRAGVSAVIAESAVDAVLVMLVDTVDVGPLVVARLVALATPDVLARASYDGEAGHPVLIGRSHWAGVRASAHGDRGARDYLRARRVSLVECGDIGSGADVDTPELLAAWRARTSRD